MKERLLKQEIEAYEPKNEKENHDKRNILSVFQMMEELGDEYTRAEITSINRSIRSLIGEVQLGVELKRCFTDLDDGDVYVLNK